MSTGCNHQGRQAGNSWKIRVREPSVPQVCFALRELSDLLLEYTGKLPGISAEETVCNIIELSVRPDDVPENGYRITVEPPENGRQRVVIRGYDPTSLMYGCMDFCFNRIPEMSLSRTTANPYYFKRLFAEDALPPSGCCECAAPSAPRSVDMGIGCV